MFNLLLKLYRKPRLIIVDIVLLNLVLMFSFILRFDVNWLKYFDPLYLVVISVLGLITLFFSNLYNRMWRYASIEELSSIIKTTFIINLLFIIFIFFVQFSFSRSIIIINWILDIFFLGGLRFYLRFVKTYLNQNQKIHAKKRVLIIGAGDAGEMIIREMRKHPELKKEVVGLIDDDPHKINLKIHGKKVLGNRNDIPRVIENHAIDEVIIAIPSASGKEVKQLYELSKIEDVKVNIVPGMYEILNGNVNLNQIREVKVEDLLRRDQVDLITDEISAYIEGKTVLVTGGAGSIGSELCRQVARFNPENLIIFDLNENNTYFLELELKKQYKDQINIITVIGSIRDMDKLRQTFSRYQPDVVFHAAAHKHVPLMENNPEEAVKNNIFGTKNVVDIADEYMVERFVLISTDKAVNPTNVMGATKRVAEMIIQMMKDKSETKYMAVRFGNVLGSQGSVIPLFKRQITDGGPVTVTHPEVTRYFMTIPEAVQLVIQTGSLGQGGEVFVLDMGEPVKIVDLARDLINLSGLKLGEDIDIKFIGLRPGEKLYEEILSESEGNIETEHERIFINNLEVIGEEKMNFVLEELGKLLINGNENDIIYALKEFIDTYQPRRDNIATAEEPLKEVGKYRAEVAGTTE